MNAVRTQSLSLGNDRADRPATPAHAPLWRRIAALFSPAANASSHFDEVRNCDMQGRINAIDRQFITGIGTHGERMLILLEIEKLMTSAEMGLVSHANAA